ncbi:transcriptional adapter 2-beta-like isoform X1 [Branchiostoma lanceolatum]|uniref:Transcriptional adapter n=1 Tax=Branchiostoma lanceolatum TaxID=7740 RepID=A0A8J9ZWN3_BRALA|nr:TADA2B [Branchiostoma lanceolatum]
MYPGNPDVINWSAEMARWRVENEQKYYCNYCQVDITTLRVKCADCNDFDLCLECFSSGAELGNHTRDHDYQIVDQGNFSLCESEWTALEELAVLEGIEQYGYGNWEEIADHIGNKTSQEVIEFYQERFIHGNLGKSCIPEESPYKVVDHTSSKDGPLSPSLSTPPQPPAELTLQEQQELGYMPLRDDFEREYDNEAESMVSTLAVNYDDDDLETALKLAQVDMFLRRLKERQRRKRIAREYGLVGIFFNKQKQQAKRKLSKDEKELRDKMKVFSQFHASEQHEQFFENLQKEKQMRSRIKELMRYRRNGITKLEECSEYEAARYKREKRKENKKKMASPAASKKGGALAGGKKPEEKEGKKSADEKDSGSDSEKYQGIKSAPCFNLLSEREKTLCSSMGMNPAKYMTVKTIIIKDHVQRRQGIPTKTRYPQNLDKLHRKRIISFLADSGWITVG